MADRDEAKWYEFWMPQSGPIGGCICAIIVFSITKIIAIIV